jgi:2-keto-4-pentenoate hydratase/2-oxohepta-3-ene-1,7-dioic acid hydratase in catechol pathway
MSFQDEASFCCHSEGCAPGGEAVLGYLVFSHASDLFAGKASSVPLTLRAAITARGGLERLLPLLQLAADHPEASRFLASEDSVHVGMPFSPNNVLCVGLNYRDHAQESNAPIPQQPVLFAKWTSAMIGPRQNIVLPPDTQEVDYEAELGVVIGRKCRGVSAEKALDYVAGYVCVNDISARDFQRTDGQWVRAKSQDTFGPVGPCLVTRDELTDPQALGIRCSVNGRMLQNSNTREMIFGVRELIAFISRGITLCPGDLISTGTPPGVGFAQKPPVFLHAGDEVVVEIDGIGRLSNPVKDK